MRCRKKLGGTSQTVCRRSQGDPCERGADRRVAGEPADVDQRMVPWPAVVESRF